MVDEYINLAYCVREAPCPQIGVLNRQLTVDIASSCVDTEAVFCIIEHATYQGTGTI